MNTGDAQPIAEVLGEGREGFRQVIRSCGLPQAIEQGARIDFEALPKVVQFNKRDFPDVKPVSEIKDQWWDTPTFPAIAVRGEGVYETFRELMRVLYRSLDERHDTSPRSSMSPRTTS